MQPYPQNTNYRMVQMKAPKAYESNNAASRSAQIRILPELSLSMILVIFLFLFCRARAAARALAAGGMFSSSLSESLSDEDGFWRPPRRAPALDPPAGAFPLTADLGTVLLPALPRFPPRLLPATWVPALGDPDSSLALSAPPIPIAPSSRMARHSSSRLSNSTMAAWNEMIA